MSGTNTQRLGLAVVGLAFVGLAGWLLWPAAPLEAAVPQHARAPARPEVAAMPRGDERSTAAARKLEKIRAARLRRLPARRAAQRPEQPAAQPCEEDCWGNLGMQVALADVVSGCAESLPPEAEGTMRFRAAVIAEPEVGAAIESVEVLEAAQGGDAFVECIVESSLLAELAEAGAPVSDDFVFRYTAGPSPDPAEEFLSSNAELLERYPALSSVVDPDSDASPSDKATTFATVISEHDDARAAFSAWVTEQGLDLSRVKVE